MPQKTAFITGVSGQDGSYLAELLLAKGYKVYGFKRPTSSPLQERIGHLLSHPAFEIIHGDLTDSASILSALKTAQPDEIYNLAGQTHVGVSFDLPLHTFEVDGEGAANILEAIRLLDRIKTTRFYQASTSELFGKITESPQNEATPFHPRSPYGAAKLYAYWMTVNYREAYGLHASNGILFNHESPRRGDAFVTRKITKALAARLSGNPAPLRLGNLNAQRDWGHARDYVDAIWRTLQQPMPDDYVVATGVTRTVRCFADTAFAYAGLPLVWDGHGTEEVGRIAQTGEIAIQIDPHFFRPAEVDILCGDASKAHQKLGWTPSCSFEQLVEEMVTEDLRRAGLSAPPLLMPHPRRKHGT